MSEFLGEKAEHLRDLYVLASWARPSLFPAFMQQISDGTSGPARIRAAARREIRGEILAGERAI